METFSLPYTGKHFKMVLSELRIYIRTITLKKKSMMLNSLGKVYLLTLFYL